MDAFTLFTTATAASRPFNEYSSEASPEAETVDYERSGNGANSYCTIAWTGRMCFI